MKNEPPYPPREGDLPREELLKVIPEAVKNCGLSDYDVDVFFKYTCQWCGERCTLDEPNVLRENGECFNCGKITPIQFGGFALRGTINHEKALRKRQPDKR